MLRKYSRKYVGVVNGNLSGIGGESFVYYNKDLGLKVNGNSAWLAWLSAPAKLVSVKQLALASGQLSGNF